MMTNMVLFSISNGAMASEVADILGKLGDHGASLTAAQPRGPYIQYETTAPFAMVVAALEGNPLAVDAVDGETHERWTNTTSLMDSIP